MLNSYTKTTVLSLLIFVAITVIGFLMASALTQSLPNDFKIPIIENFTFYTQLMQINPLITLRQVLIDNPVIISQRLDVDGKQQIWAAYIMPINILINIGLSVLYVKTYKLNFNSCKWAVICLASLLLTLSLFYMKIQACCSSRASWLGELAVLYQINNPFSDTAFWQNIYIELSNGFIILQSILLVSAFVLFYLIYTNKLCKK